MPVAKGIINCCLSPPLSFRNTGDIGLPDYYRIRHRRDRDYRENMGANCE
jgi:hypothetical protein